MGPRPPEPWRASPPEPPEPWRASDDDDDNDVRDTASVAASGSGAAFAPGAAFASDAADVSGAALTVEGSPAFSLCFSILSCCLFSLACRACQRAAHTRLLSTRSAGVQRATGPFAYLLLFCRFVVCIQRLVDPFDVRDSADLVELVFRNLLTAQARVSVSARARAQAQGKRRVLRAQASLNRVLGVRTRGCTADERTARVLSHADVDHW